MTSEIDLQPLSIHKLAFAVHAAIGANLLILGAKLITWHLSGSRQDIPTFLCPAYSFKTFNMFKWSIASKALCSYIHTLWSLVLGEIGNKKHASQKHASTLILTLYLRRMQRYVGGSCPFVCRYSQSGKSSGSASPGCHEWLLVVVHLMSGSPFVNVPF